MINTVLNKRSQMEDMFPTSTPTSIESTRTDQEAKERIKKIAGKILFTLGIICSATTLTTAIILFASLPLAPSAVALALIVGLYITGISSPLLSMMVFSKLHTPFSTERNALKSQIKSLNEEIDKKGKTDSLFSEEELNKLQHLAENKARLKAKLEIMRLKEENEIITRINAKSGISRLIENLVSRPNFV